MLPLHRTLHCSASMQRGHLTTGLSWLLEVDKPLANQERSFDRNTFTRQRILYRNRQVFRWKGATMLSRLSCSFLAIRSESGSRKCPLHVCIVVRLF